MVYGPSSIVIDAVLLAKFKRRAPRIASQQHLDKAMFLFPADHHDGIAIEIQPLLKPELIARKVDVLPELKLKDPDNPTLHEQTAQRLNNHAAQVADLQKQIATLQTEREELHAAVVDRDGQIENLKVLIGAESA